MIASTVPADGQRVHYRDADPVCRELVALRVAGTTGAAHQVLVGPLNDKVARIITAFVRSEKLERLERWLAPIRAALLGVVDVPLSNQLIVEAQQADALEEITEARFNAHNSIDNAQAWLRAMDAASAKSLELRAALSRWITDQRERQA